MSRSGKCLRWQRACGQRGSQGLRGERCLLRGAGCGVALSLAWGTSVCLLILCGSLSWPCRSTYTHVHFCGARSRPLLPGARCLWRGPSMTYLKDRCPSSSARPLPSVQTCVPLGSHLPLQTPALLSEGPYSSPVPVNRSSSTKYPQFLVPTIFLPLGFVMSHV